jgi:hypothetical protein
MSCLHWWALHIAITAKHTTVARFGLQQAVTVFTFVEKLTGIGGHVFRFLETAVWTG